MYKKTGHGHDGILKLISCAFFSFVKKKRRKNISSIRLLTYSTSSTSNIDFAILWKHFPRTTMHFLLSKCKITKIRVPTTPCKFWHCLFFCVDLEMFFGRAADANPFWSIKTWRNLGELCRFYMWHCSSISRPKVPRKWRVAEKFHFISSGSLTKCQFQMFIHDEINFYFPLHIKDQKLPNHLCILYLLKGNLILFPKPNCLSVGCSPMGNIFAQNCLQLLPKNTFDGYLRIFNSFTRADTIKQEIFIKVTTHLVI